MQFEDDWVAYCPSYKRADTCITHKLFSPEKFIYVVREEEAKAYEKHGYPLKVIPKGTVSNLAQTLNWLLENSDYRNIIRLDDDISSMLFLHHRDRQKLGAKQIERFVVQMFDLCYNMGTTLWGVNLVPDPMGYSINKPFSFNTPILGPWSGHIIDELRYDESLFLKEDYDFYLQKVNKYGLAIRANYVSYQCDHFNMAGGCQTYRTTEEERRQQDLLQKKWGSKIIRYNERNPESVNMRIRLT